VPTLSYGGLHAAFATSVLSVVGLLRLDYRAWIADSGITRPSARSGLTRGGCRRDRRRWNSAAPELPILSRPL
jgi:hypothetical protein